MSLSSSGAKSLTSLPAIFALCASASDCHAIEVAGSGLFTKHLLNESGLVQKIPLPHLSQLLSLFAYITKGVLAESRNRAVQLSCLALLPCYSCIKCSRLKVSFYLDVCPVESSQTKKLSDSVPPENFNLELERLELAQQPEGPFPAVCIEFLDWQL